MNNNFKTGFITLIGRPNVGKSTLMNQMIGQKIAITSSKPQTTRNKIMTVYTDDECQMIFLDTPGIHETKNKLGEYMTKVAKSTLEEDDVVGKGFNTLKSEIAGYQEFSDDFILKKVNRRIVKNVFLRYEDLVDKMPIFPLLTHKQLRLPFAYS